MRSIVVIMVLAHTLSFRKADVHSWGGRFGYNHQMYERVLIDENNSVPKDYTILYKYYGAHYKPVAYIEIDVDTKSDGYMNMKRGKQDSYFGQKEYIQTFNAHISIKNATNVKAKLKILGVGYFSMPNTGLHKRQDTKSLIYVHVKKSNPSLQKQFFQNSIGKRRNGDYLLHFESRNVTNQNRFPSRAFEYSGGEYITYVGFSFSSPTAMVMINTTFVDEQEFNAVVYDVNAEHFVANVSVYGVKSIFRPDAFLGVI